MEALAAVCLRTKAMAQGKFGDHGARFISSVFL
jgi:hypothetical protein